MATSRSLVQRTSGLCVCVIVCDPETSEPRGLCPIYSVASQKKVKSIRTGAICVIICEQYFIIYRHIKFCVPKSNGSLVLACKSNFQENFAPGLLLFGQSAKKKRKIARFSIICYNPSCFPRTDSHGHDAMTDQRESKKLQGDWTAVMARAHVYGGLVSLLHFLPSCQ